MGPSPHRSESQTPAGGRFVLADRWLLVVAVASTLMGVAMTVAPESPLMRPYTDRVARAFWHQAPVPPAARAHASWLLQILGSTIAGWGVLLTLVVAGPFRRREAWAWWAVLGSVSAWIALDVAVSVMAGVMVEAAMAAGFSFLVGVPLALAWQSFEPRDR